MGSEKDENGANVYSSDLIGKRGTQICQDNPDSGEYGAFLTGAEAKKYYSYFKKNTETEKDFDGDNNQTEYNRAYARKNNLPVMPSASQGQISKTVRADENKTAEFLKETAVTTGGGYTYRISLNAFSTDALGDIVIYDELEKTEQIENKNEYWQGTFQSVDVSAFKNYLLLQGVSQSDISEHLKIYYTHNESPEPPVQKDTTDTTKYTQNLITDFSGTGWIETSDGRKNITDNDESRITAIAVVYDGKINTGSTSAITQLKTSIDIKMKAPESLEAANSTYPFAKNISWYSVAGYRTGENGAVLSVPVGHGESNPTVVTIGEKMKLIVSKQLGASVPDELKDEVFNFHINAYVGSLKDDGEITVEEDLPPIVEEEPFSNVPYLLYQKNDEQAWEQIEVNIPHTTDADGGLQLKADQKAEFTYISMINYGTYNINADNLAKREIDAYDIEEEVKPYWYATKEVSTVKNQKDDETNITYHECSVSFTNDFRPVIYLNKTVGYVPEYLKKLTRHLISF